MPYVLGIDVGGRNTTAAVCRLDRSTWQPTELVRLAGRAPGVDSVLYLGQDGATSAGEAAAARAAAEPDRIARGFLRRIGDDVPMVVGGEQYAAAELAGLLVGWVIERAATEEGARPDHVVLTHPADWGTHRRGLLHAELSAQGLVEVTLLPEPIAAAESYVARGRLDPSASVGVHAAGAENTASAVLRRARTGAFELLGTANGAGADPGTEPLGGSHLDDLLLEHVRAALGTALSALDPTDPAVRTAVGLLRAECRRAKETLSTAAEAVIPVGLPGVDTEIRLDRAEFEELIRPSVRAAAERLTAALRYAAVPATELAAVVLVGGTARIPLVAEVLAEVVDCRISVEADPEHTVVRGAALAARRLASRRRGRVALPGPEQQTRLLPRIDGGVAPRPTPTLDAPSDDFAEPPARPGVEVRPLELATPRRVGELVPWLRPSVLGVLVVLVIVAGVVATFVWHIGIGTSPASPATGGTRPPVSTASHVDNPAGPSLPAETEGAH